MNISTSLFLVVLFIPGLAAMTSAQLSPASLERLRCEYRVDPLGIDVVQPRLSWEMRDERRGAVQSAYQILVARTAETLGADTGDLWDSGKVESHQSTQIAYAGVPLSTGTTCHWKVRIWDAHEKPTGFSPPALWTLGLLRGDDVKARWIGVDGPMVHPVMRAVPLTLEGCPWIWVADDTDETGKTARKGKADKKDKTAAKDPLTFRASVTIPEGHTLTRARFLLAAAGGFELIANSRSAGLGRGGQGPLLIDLTHRLHAGRNELALEVRPAPRGKPSGLMGRLVIETEDHEPLVKKIDATWQAQGKVVEVSPPFARVMVCDGIHTLASAYLRKPFRLESPVRRARVHASALGLYELRLNGQRVSKDLFTPDWTDYKKRVYYNTYDVTSLLRSAGENVLGGILNAGWYAGAIGWNHQRFHHGTDPKLFVQLEVELEDGTRQVITTDGSWKWSFGPCLESEFLAGETHDARREMPSWDAPGFEATGWHPVKVVASISAKLQAFPGVTVQETGELKPVNITQPEPGRFVFDLGQNFAGFARLRVKGPAGTRVALQYGEMLRPDGTVYTENLRSARAVDTYILKGNGLEVWQPRFTYHGFRYVEVTGYPGQPGPEAITGVAIHSATPLVGSFECSRSMVNRLYRNIVWTQRANFISVPTDCPQRDERMGWTGDAQVFVRAATYNADVAAFYTKWLVDLEDAQCEDGGFPDVAPRVVIDHGGTAAWGDAGTICPWTIYQVYGDRRVLETHYDAMERWIAYGLEHSRDLLRPARGYGDWLSIKADTPKDLLATAFFARSTAVTARVARVLGRKAEAAMYEQLFSRIRDAFQQAYVSADGRIRGDTQTGYVLALAFDLLPEEMRARAAQFLVEDIQKHDMHLSTGFLGTSRLMPVLSAAGYIQVAYCLLLNNTFPSWGYSIKHGATTIWERWDGWTAENGFQDPRMNSFCHYSFGAVGEWLFGTVAGIDTDGPGFQRLTIRPEPAEGLTWARARYHSIHGPMATAWRTRGESFSLEVTIPANTRATVYVPTSDPATVRESRQPVGQAEGVTFLRAEPGAAVYAVGAGTYRFTSRWAGREAR